MAADACFDVLSNDAFLTEFCQEKMKTAEGADFIRKIADFFVALAKKLRQIVRDLAHSTDNAIVRELIDDEQMLSEINKRFKELLDSAKAVDNSTDGVVKSEVKFAKGYSDNLFVDSYIVPSNLEAFNKVVVRNTNDMGPNETKPFDAWGGDGYYQIFAHTDDVGTVKCTVRGISTDEWKKNRKVNYKTWEDIFDESERNGETFAEIVGIAEDGQNERIDISGIHDGRGDATPYSLDDSGAFEREGSNGAQRFDRSRIDYERDRAEIAEIIKKLKEMYGIDDGVRFQRSLETVEERDKADLLRENEMLREQVEYLRGETRLTDGATIDRGKLFEAVKGVLKSYDGGIKSDVVRAVSDRLRATYGYLRNGIAPAALQVEIYREAEKILSASGRIEGAEEYSDEEKSMRTTLRKVGITLNEEQMGEIAHAYGSMQEFRKMAIGHMTLRKEGGMPLDSIWESEIVPAYPELRDVTSSAEMPIKPCVFVINIMSLMLAKYSKTPPRLRWSFRA